jgi:hypothetical protein
VPPAPGSEARNAYGDPVFLRMMLATAGLAVLLVGCSNDDILTGPTPAGVTTTPPSASSSTPPLSTPPSSTPALSTPAPGSGPSGAEVLADLERKVLQAEGGCWEPLAPGAPSGASRQDLWFAPGMPCGGAGWSIALQVFSTSASLNGATRVSNSAVATYQDGLVPVLVLVAPAASSAVRSQVASLGELEGVPPGGR